MNASDQIIPRPKISCKDTPGLSRPQSLNEKIKWLLKHDRNPLMPVCVDKLKVKEYVREKIGMDICPESIAVANSVQDLYQKIKVSLFHPQKFFIKANNDSGGTTYIDGNLDEWVLGNGPSIIEAHRHRPYGVEKGEWFYQHVPYKCFSEKSLGNNIIDYKFHCSLGEPRFCQVVSGRQTKNGPKEAIVSLEGDVLGFHLCRKMEKTKQFDKPYAWGQMKKIAQKLSSDFAYVRVDLFCVDAASSKIEGNVFFGELTFAPAAGNHKGIGHEEAGKLLPLSMEEKCLSDLNGKLARKIMVKLSDEENYLTNLSRSVAGMMPPKHLENTNYLESNELTVCTNN